jgi:multiple sugar transport system substrate-binding protein
VSSDQLSRRAFLSRTGKTALAAGMGGSMLAACGSSSSSSKPTAASSGGGGSKPTIKWWDYLVEPARQPGMKALVADIESNVGVKIERRTFQYAQLNPAVLQAAIAGNLPDILITDNTLVRSLWDQHIITDLTADVQKWGQSDKYIQGSWKAGDINGTIVSIPNNANCLSLWYDAKALDKAGIKPPTTWSELTAAAKELTTPARKGLAMSAVKGEEGVFQFLPFLWQSGGDLPTFGQTGAAPLTFLHDFIKNGSMSSDVLGWTQQDANTAFAAGRAAMQVNGPWQLPTLQQTAKGIHYNVALLPVGKTSASCLGGEHWAICATSKYKDECWAIIERSQVKSVLINFLDGLGLLPARNDMADVGNWAHNPIYQVFLKQLPTARPRSYPKYPTASAAVSQAEQAALTGAQSPTAAVAAVASTVTSAVKS